MEACEIPRWQVLKSSLTNLDPEDFKTKLDQISSAKLLDVRTPSEVQEISLVGSIHLDYFGDGFLDQLDLLDRDGYYFLYCRTGRRSVRTGVLMHNWGFKNVVNLEGGLVAWEKTFAKPGQRVG